MRLRLIDEETGQAPKGVDVSYCPLIPTRMSAKSPAMRGWGVTGRITRESGRTMGPTSWASCPVPGPWPSARPGMYRPACVDPKAFFDPEGVKKADQGMVYGDRSTLFIAVGEGFGGTPQSQFSAIVLVNPAKDAAPSPPRPCSSATAGARSACSAPTASPWPGWPARVRALRPRSTRPDDRVGAQPDAAEAIYFRHAGRKLVGFLLARGDEAEPYTVRLVPWGTIAGRLVDAEGRPRPKAHLATVDWGAAMNDPARGILADVRTDDQGRFRVEGLVPGQSYTADAVGEEALNHSFGFVIERVVLKPGETRDLGDVRARVPKPEGDQ